MRTEQGYRTRSFCRFRLALIAFILLLSTSKASPAQSQGKHGSISGTVTADQGTVRAFRVKARDAAHAITYTVFTKAGHYHVPELVPSTYEVQVLEEGYQSPVQKVELSAGKDSSGVDLALKKMPPKEAPIAQDYDTLYPPGPGRDLIANLCMGCHGLDYYNRLHRTEAGWRTAVDTMTTGLFFNFAPPLGRTQLSFAQKDTIIKYLADNFGPDSPDRILKPDSNFQRDEDALGDAIFIEYDAPKDWPYLGTKGTQIIDGRFSYGSGHRLHDPYVAADDTIWYGASGANEEVQLDQFQIDPAKRWKQFPINSTDVPNVFIHGNATDSKGHVYWAEIIGGRLGELDPETGKITRHYVPTVGSMLQVVVDKNDNVWYAEVHGSVIGKLDAKTRKITQWSTPTPDSSPYGLAAGPDGTIWAAGYGKNMVIKVDPETGTVTEYKTPTQPSGTRRIGVDSKGLVWVSEFTAGQFASLDPKTGKFTEYKLPYRYTAPYETWPDKEDNIWMTDHFYGSLIHYDRKTKKFAYYPYPQGTHWSVPKVEIDKDNTVWFGSRGVPNIVAVHFYPNGYTATQKARW